MNRARSPERLSLSAPLPDVRAGRAASFRPDEDTGSNPARGGTKDRPGAAGAVWRRVPRVARPAVFCMALACLSLPGAVHSEDAENRDCEPEGVRFDAGKTPLTRAERIALMDAAFHESLARFDACRTAARGGARGGGGGAEPAAAAGVRGSEAEASGETRRGVPGTGKIPEDIPDGENDGVLEAQIRLAATRETDPAVRARLWNEYRKYKGLPVEGENSDAEISE